MSIETRIEELTAAVKALTTAIVAAGTVPTATIELKAKPAKGKAAPSAEATAASVTEPQQADAEVAQPGEAVATEPAATPPTAETSAAPESKVESSVPVAANDATYEDVRKAFMELNQAKGRDATLAVLKQFNAAKVPDIPAAQFGAAVAAAKAAM